MYSGQNFVLQYAAAARDRGTTAASEIARLLNSRPVWTIADQAVVSLGNFVSGVILARHLPEAGYGAYAVLLETMLFLNSLHAALVTYPMSVHGATHDPATIRRFGSAALWMTLALAPMLGIAIGIGTFCGANQGGGTVEMLLLAVSAVAGMLLWQMQETMRRGLMAELRFAAAIPGDAISYLGQVALLFAAASSGSLTLPRAFLIIGATSSLAVVLQATQIGIVRISLAELRSIARDFWKLGSWMLLANLAMIASSLGYTWTLRIFHGLNATATFAAMLVPLKVVNPMLMGVGNLLVPAVARISRREGARATIRAASRYALLGAAVIFSYYGLLCAFPTVALRIVFGAGSPYLEQATLLRFYLLNMVMVYIEIVLLGWLSGLGETRANFVTQTFQAITTLLIGLPLTARYGIPGLITGGLISTSVCVIAQWIMLRKALAPERAASGEPMTESAESLPAPG